MDFLESAIIFVSCTGLYIQEILTGQVTVKDKGVRKS